ncbi:beta-galactosidase/beta-glucuronidase [Paenibacillus terrae HPL-003]|uniref:Beta-mannosidase B n=1 Tax=Paenibacillus terrae (strain HPL-003) TaxID=985665 RepID=G7VZC5_PAETH|nr:glycoside hydrolase family 2 protein [Paenibacillus terrae]AET60219.1 beta-galactosidase/beta-glucuronidase [Paenibacillus terrae HPL-003]
MFNVTGLDNWRFREAQGDEWLSAKVPGCVHTDLLRHGKIPDPFIGTNEEKVQWIDKQDWIYEAHFEMSVEQLQCPCVELVLEGLDTYAEVKVNGHPVLSANNMFRMWRRDVKAWVQQGENRLEIAFRSPVAEDVPKLEQLGYALPAPNDQSEAGGLADKKVSVFARKAPYHYGWDWGPRLVTSGIWREVRVEAWSGLIIRDLFIRQDELSAEGARLTAVAEIENAGEIREADLRISADGREWLKPVRLQKGRQTVDLELYMEQPKLWWCRGLGEPHLYTFAAELVERDGGDVIAEKTVKTGLRSIRLVRERDAAGESFYFELNGVPVFAKGANHIPNDSFTTEVTRERYRHEIATAAASHMNMLRVWGGGIYEEDVFYELCDEYGLLIWQDFMFACSMYPGDQAFLDNVAKEAEDNIKRLRNHPCIALWCGNNEIDSAWAHYEEKGGWGWKKNYTPAQRERLWSDYETLFHRILPEVVHSWSPQTAYWPSSPLIGLSGDRKQHAHPSSTAGDVHYWGVWHASEPFENYHVHVGRFMSEYGFQSFPEYRSVRAYAEENDLELESVVMLAHQKNGAGNRLIKEYMERYMREPKDFKAFLPMSQILQAEAMKMAIEAHRRRKPYCMGTLYWQMNDCWPVASWSSMDYFGRWKALQYTAKRSFADVLLSVVDTEQGNKELHIVNDTLKPVQGTLRLTLLHIRGSKVIREEDIQVEQQANAAGPVHILPADKWLNGLNPAEHMLVARLIQNGEQVASCEVYFADTKEMDLPQPNIEVTEVQGSGESSFNLRSDVLARHVWLSAEQEGIFSDNHLDLAPGISKTVGFLALGRGGSAFEAASPGKLTVRSLVDWIQG